MNFKYQFWHKYRKYGFKNMEMLPHTLSQTILSSKIMAVTTKLFEGFMANIGYMMETDALYNILLQPSHGVIMKIPQKFGLHTPQWKIP